MSNLKILKSIVISYSHNPYFKTFRSNYFETISKITYTLRIFCSKRMTYESQYTSLRLLTLFFIFDKIEEFIL